MSTAPLLYEISHCSSWDDDYGPEQLLGEEDEGNVPDESRSPKFRGWQTKKQPTYPQDLIIHVLPGPAHISKIQLLSHHYKIATKIDIYIGVLKDPSSLAENDLAFASPDEADMENDDMVIEFTRLGYIRFDDNAKAGYRAREFKSVHINTVGEYIRLVIRNCHQNKYNSDNQVSLLAFNVIGQGLGYGSDAHVYTGPRQSRVYDDSSFLSSSTRRSSVSSDYSLSHSAMVPEAEIQSWVTVLRSTEQQALRDQKYMVEEKCKTVRNALEALLRPLKDLEAKMVRAIEEQNYTSASELRSMIHSIKDSAHLLIQDSGIEVLAEESVPKVEETHEPPPAEHSQHSMLQDSLFDEAIENWITFDVTSSAQEHTLSEETSPEPVIESTADVAISADTSQPVVEVDLVQAGLVSEAPVPVPVSSEVIIPPTTVEPQVPEHDKPRRDHPEPTLSESVMRKIRENSIHQDEDIYDSDHESASVDDDQERRTQAVSVFGSQVVEDVRNLKAPRRESGLKQVQKLVTEACKLVKEKNLKQLLLRFKDVRGLNASERVALFVNATLFMVQEAILDYRAPIILSAFGIWKKLNEFCSIRPPDVSLVFDAVERAFNCLLRRTSHENKELREESIKLVISLAKLYNTPPYSVIPLFVGKPRRLAHNQKEIKYRMTLVESAMAQIGLSEDDPNTIQLDDFVAFVKAYSVKPGDDVQESIAQLVVCACGHVTLDTLTEYLGPNLLKTIDETMKRLGNLSLEETSAPKRKQAPKTPNRSAPARKTVTMTRTTTLKRREPASLKSGSTTATTTASSQQAKQKKTVASKSTRPTQPTRATKTPKPESKPTKSRTIKSQSTTKMNKCIFCDEESPDFNEETLIEHYHKFCPSLTNCSFCDELVEKADLENHKKRECPNARANNTTRANAW